LKEEKLRNIEKMPLFGKKKTVEQELKEGDR
jgi:hypothetical protein